MKMITLLILGLVSLLLISFVSAQVITTYTTDSKEDCANGICSLMIYSKPMYANKNGTWKDVNTLPSLLNTSYFCSITKSLPLDADVTCLDYNFTWMKLGIVFHETGQIPIREVAANSGIEINRQTFNVNQNMLGNYYIFEVDINKGSKIHVGENSTTVGLIGSSSKMDGYFGEFCGATRNLNTTDNVVSVDCTNLGVQALTNAAEYDNSYIQAGSTTGANNEGAFLRVRANINTTTYVRITRIRWAAQGKVGDLSSAQPDLYVWNFTKKEYYRYSTNPWGLSDTSVTFDTKSSNLNPSEFINATNKRLYWMFEETDTNDVNINTELDYIGLGIEYTNVYPIVANVTINDTLLAIGEEVKFSANISTSTVGYINLSKFQVRFPNATSKNFSGTNTRSNTITANTVIKTDGIPSATNYTVVSAWVFQSSSPSCRGGNTCYRYPGSTTVPGLFNYNINLDGSAYDSCNVSAWINRLGAMDTGEYSCLDWSVDGTFWNADSDSGGSTEFCLDEGETADAYVKINSSNFRPSQNIRWRGRAFGNAAAEGSYFDDVTVTCQRRLNNEVWNYEFNETYQTGIYNLTRVMGKDEYLVENSSFTNKGFTVSSGADTCTYVSGDWNLNCADACVISSPVDVGANNIIMTGTGNIWFNAAIRAKTVMMPSRTTSCTAHFKAGLN